MAPACQHPRPIEAQAKLLSPNGRSSCVARKVGSKAMLQLHFSLVRIRISSHASHVTKVKEGGDVMRKISATKRAALERDKAEEAHRAAVLAEIETLTPPSVPAFEREPPPGVDPDQFAELL